MHTSGRRTAWALSLLLLLGSALWCADRGDPLRVAGATVTTDGNAGPTGVHARATAAAVDVLTRASRELSWRLLAGVPAPQLAPPVTLGLRN